MRKQKKKKKFSERDPCTEAEHSKRSETALGLQRQEVVLNVITLNQEVFQSSG